MLALATIVLVVVAVTVNMLGPGNGPLPVPTPQPTPEPSPEPIPEAVTIAFSRPIPPDERPGDTLVVAVPSPEQVEAEGRKDWPEAAFSVWVECTDLLDRKEFDQAITRMNEVAARSTDRGVRAVTATCRAAAQVNNGDFAEAEPDLEEARREVDSLGPDSGLDLNFTVNLTVLMSRVASSGSASNEQKIVSESEIRLAADKVNGDLTMLSYRGSDGSYYSTLAAVSMGVGYSVCRGSGGAGACEEVVLVAVTALPSLRSGLQPGMVATIMAIARTAPQANPPNPPAPGTPTTTNTKMPTTTTTAANTTTQATTTSQEPSTTTEESTTTTTPPKTTTTKKSTTTSTTTKTTTPETTTSMTTTSNGDGG